MSKTLPLIPFAEYAPDISDLETRTSKDITNVVPRGDGYGPITAQSLTGTIPQFTGATGPSGFFAAKNADGTFTMFAGSTTRLYKVSAGSWTDVGFVTGGITTTTSTPPTIVSAGTVSATSTTTGTTYTSVAVTGGSGSGALASVTVSSVSGVTNIVITTQGSGYKWNDTNLSCASSNIGSVSGFNFTIPGFGSNVSAANSYTSVLSGKRWRFTQYNQTVIAVQDQARPQYLTLGTNQTNFADLGGNVNPAPKAAFVGVINGFVMLSGLSTGSVPYRIQWSDLDNIQTWVAGTGQSDFQDLGDGGNALDIAGFDLYGIVFQEEAARLLTYVGGSIVFQINKIQGGTGNGLFQPYSMCIADNRVFWVSPTGIKMVIPGSNPVQIGKERVDRTFISNILSLGQTFWNATISANDPNATRVYFCQAAGLGFFQKVYCYDYALDKWSLIDLTDGGVNNVIWTGLGAIQQGGNANTVNVPIAGTTDDSGNFASLSTTGRIATLETPEQGADGRRIYTRGFRPFTDAPTCFGSASYRDTPIPPQYGIMATATIFTAGSGSTGSQTFTAVPLNGGSGSGAQATIVTTGAGVKTITITNGGSKDYAITSLSSLAISVGGTGGTSGTGIAVSFTGGTGSGATGTVTIGTSGGVTSVSVSSGSPGSGFDPGDTLGITSTSSSVTLPTGAAFTITVLCDQTPLTASTSNIGNITGFAAQVATLNAYNYTAEAQVNPRTGLIPLRQNARYMRAKIRIPANLSWTYAKGVEPDGGFGGLR